MEEKENLHTEAAAEEDIRFMREALLLAMEARDNDEVPVGAVCVKDGRVIGRGANRREASKCATHHAEVLAIEEACRTLGGWRLPGVTLYVTMEPCVMCGGAIINSRIPRVVYGTKDLRFGAFGSALDLVKIPLNHTPTVISGVLSDECRELLSSYFKSKRK